MKNSIFKLCFALTLATSLKLSAHELEICPKWTVQVLDGHGNVMTNCNVSEDWLFFGLSEEKNDEKKTDSTGSVSFPPRSINVSEARYVAAHAASLLNVHASFEPSAHIEVSAAGFKGTIINYDDHKLWLSDSGSEGTETNNEIKTKVRLKPLDLIDITGSHNLDAVKKFVSNNPASVKMQDSLGWTPLHHAADDLPGSFEIASFLIDAGADVNAKAKDSRTPLHQAAHNGAVQIMSLLISKGADVNAVIHNPVRISEDLYTPLHVALSWGGGNDETKIKMIDLLVKQGANVNAKARFDETPLFEAAYLAGPSVVKELLEKGADPNIRNTDGKSPLDMAKEFKKTENVKVLEDFALKQK